MPARPGWRARSVRSTGRSRPAAGLPTAHYRSRRWRSAIGSTILPARFESRPVARLLSHRERPACCPTRRKGRVPWRGPPPRLRWCEPSVADKEFVARSPIYPQGFPYRNVRRKRYTRRKNSLCAKFYAKNMKFFSRQRPPPPRKTPLLSDMIQRRLGLADYLRADLISDFGADHCALMTPGSPAGKSRVTPRLDLSVNCLALSWCCRDGPCTKVRGRLCPEVGARSVSGSYK